MRCPRCAAVGSQPCITPAGNFAAHRHKARPVDLVGEIERLTTESVEAAAWIEATDAAKVGVVISLAREADQAIRAQEDRVRAESAVLFETDGKPGDIDGTFVYLVVSLGLLLDSLGLSPKGRSELAIESGTDDSDDLADLLQLHGKK